jgi:hypothetical protein
MRDLSRGNGVNQIILTKGKIAFIDPENYAELSQYRWSYLNLGYATRTKNGKKIYMHRQIMNLKDNGKIVDHINGNGLDNRKCNLRICSKGENGRHRIKLPLNNKSGHIGVYFFKLENKWKSAIIVNGQTIYLGRYDNLEDAIRVRKEAEIKYHGEFKQNI